MADYLSLLYTREMSIAMLHADIHRSGKGCCCPGEGVICPPCPQHHDKADEVMARYLERRSSHEPA